MKRILILSLVLALGLGAQAQRFEWAKGYASGGDVDIKGSFTDSLGNLYILGQCNPNSKWEYGSNLLPVEPFSQNQVCILIAKISPEGNLVWKKIIYSRFNVPHGITPLGDTAFACFVTMSLASDSYGLYYLDTMINAPGFDVWPDYPMSAQGRYDKTQALITFDFDGNVIGQEFLQFSFLDENGDDIYAYSGRSEPSLYTDNYFFQSPYFAIDKDGNVYLSGMFGNLSDCPVNMPEGGFRVYSVMDGTLTGVKVWCNRRPIGVIPVDSTNLDYHLIKFAPHCDTLLQHRFVYQKSDGGLMTGLALKCDERRRLYAYSWMTGSTTPGIVVFDSSQGMSFPITHTDARKGFLLVFPPDSLCPTRLITLGSDVIRPEINHSYISFNDIAFDHDSNLLFIQVTAGLTHFGDTVNFYAYPTYNGERLHVGNQLFFMALDMDDYSLHSYGRANGLYLSSDDYNLTHHGIGNMVCKNNRVFMQSINQGGVNFPDESVVFPNWTYVRPGLNILDYQGHLIGGLDYATNSSQEFGPLELRDSILYIIDRLSDGPTYGDLRVDGRGAHFVCIAKGVDTAFMHPYKSTDKDPGIRVEVVQEGLTVIRYPNPTTGHLTIVMNGRRLSRAYLAGADGKAQPLAVSPAGDDRYSADLSAFPDGSYTLILVSDPEHAYRSQVILQRR